MMSLTGHEEIGRVGRVGRGCYEDPREDVRNKSCLWTSEKRHRHTDKPAALHHSRPPADQSAGQGSRRTRTTRYGYPREDVTRMLRGKRSRGIQA